MATRTRDTGPGREKRGTSPSHTPTTPQRRTSPNPSKTISPARQHDSDKHVPNYLKPTISSGLDLSKQQGKKPVPGETSSPKPTLTRRRSFDKPTPPPSRTQKSRVSPNPTLRSSSFSGKTTTSQKPLVSDKSSKPATKDAAKQRSTLYARPVSTTTVKKSSTIYVKKQATEGNTSSTVDDHQVVISTSEKVDEDITDQHVPEPETQPENQESVITEAEEQIIVQVGSNEEKGVEDTGTKDQELVNIEESESDKEGKIVNVETSTVLEDAVAVKNEEPEEKLQIEETSSKLQELEERTVQEISNFTDEIVAENPTAELLKEKEGDNKKEEAASGSEAQESKEPEVAEEEKKEVAPPKQQVVQGKIKDSAVSNDVIEETASKLREQRKNKVKALAGAFETVISLQEPK